MFKYILGWFLAILGFIFSFFTIIYTLTQSSSGIEYFVGLLFLTPSLLIFYWGVKIIIKYLKKKKENRIKQIPPEKIIIEWEIIGKDWERFKEKKCSPEAIKKSSLINSGLIAFFGALIIYLSLYYENADHSELFALGMGLITFFISLYYTKKFKNNVYGHLYQLSSGYCKISYEYADFCGNIIALNSEGRFVGNVSIIQKLDLNTLNINIQNYNSRSFSNNLELPIPFEKIKDADEIRKNIKGFKWSQ